MPKYLIALCPSRVGLVGDVAICAATCTALKLLDEGPGGRPVPILRCCDTPPPARGSDYIRMLRYAECNEMNYKIEAAILKLRADAIGVVFTGFVTDAQVVPPAMLKGEVWGHVLADGFGTFADGHRIETSDIVQIHSRGDSLWVSTRSGSDYGILSFAPLGWMYFADLYKAHQRLDPHPPGSPIWQMELPQERAPGLAFERKGLVSQKTDPQAVMKRKRKLLGPEENTEYMDRMSVFIDETIETFKRTGVNIPGSDN